jgi:hypothetical protein
METRFSAMHHLPVRDLERLATILRVAAEKGWGHYVEHLRLKGYLPKGTSSRLFRCPAFAYGAGGTRNHLRQVRPDVKPAARPVPAKPNQRDAEAARCGALFSRGAETPHSMHLHGFSFQVVSRHNSPNQVRKFGHGASGRTITDLGWKDTILVWLGETVRISIDFTNGYKGDQIYLFHCHNLECED